MTVAEVKHLMRLAPINKKHNEENRANDAIQNNF
jgi:hypothetical protein